MRFPKITIILLVVIVLSGCIATKTNKKDTIVSGQVVDENGKGVSNVPILIGFTTIVNTDINGFFKIRVANKIEIRPYSTDCIFDPSNYTVTASNEELVFIQKPLVNPSLPIIESITLSTRPNDKDTIIELDILVRSNVPVKWLNRDFVGPNGNIYGGGSSRQFEEISPGLWHLVESNRVSQYAPNGEYYYTDITVRNEAMLTSSVWNRDLKTYIANSIVADIPIIESIMLSTQPDAGDTIIELDILVRSNVPVKWLNRNFVGPNGNIYGGGSSRQFEEISPELWHWVESNRVSQYAPNGEYYYTDITVRNEAMLTSSVWNRDLKTHIANSIVADIPIIESITLSTQPDAGDTIIELDILVRSNVPVKWLNRNFVGPNGNIYGGGSSRQFEEISPGLWHWVESNRVSQYAPNGEYYYTDISVRNEGMLTSQIWHEELKTVVTSPVK